MEAQICKLLSEFCSYKIRDIYMAAIPPDSRGIRRCNDADKEPWLLCQYINPYHNTLRDAVIILRKLYQYW